MQNLSKKSKSSAYSTANYPGKAKMLLYSYFQQNIFSVCSMSHYYVWDHMCGSAGGQVKVLTFTPSATESSPHWRALLLIPLLICFVLFNYFLKWFEHDSPYTKSCLQFWGLSNHYLKYQQHLELYYSRTYLLLESAAGSCSRRQQIRTQQKSKIKLCWTQKTKTAKTPRIYSHMNGKG